MQKTKKEKKKGMDPKIIGAGVALLLIIGGGAAMAMKKGDGEDEFDEFEEEEY